MKNKHGIWQGQIVEILEEIRPNLLGDRMVRIQASAHQIYEVPLKDIGKFILVEKAGNNSPKELNN